MFRMFAEVHLFNDGHPSGRNYHPGELKKQGAMVRNMYDVTPYFSQIA
jgi:hypothetical protein